MQLLYTHVYWKKFRHCLAHLGALDRRRCTDTAPLDTAPLDRRRCTDTALKAVCCGAADVPKDLKHTSGHSVVLKGLCSRCQSLALPKRLHMRSG